MLRGRGVGGVGIACNWWTVVMLRVEGLRRGVYNKNAAS